MQTFKYVCKGNYQPNKLNALKRIKISHMKTTLNTAEEIKQAVDAGKKVFAGTPAYQVIKDKINQYLIHYINSDHYIGLTWNDNTTLNGSEFYFID